MARMTYAEQLKHPNWQKRRLERLGQANWECENCGEKEVTLHVHHKHYVKGRMAWEYEEHELGVLCETCHEQHHISEKILQELLMHYNLDEAIGLLGGYKLAEPDIDPGDREMWLQCYAPAYQLGFVASLLGFCDTSFIQKVVRDALDTIPPHFEIHQVFSKYKDDLRLE